MLVQLDIENIAVIERASIEFDSGLNVITGETGAGKSLLINALNMVLGARSARDLIREGADFARVGAVFFCPECDELLKDSDVATDEGNIIISRKLYRDGRNICHINQTAVTVSTLRSIGEKLVVIHGQHDSGELMDTSTHIHFLDAFSENRELLTQYREIYREYRRAESELSKMCEDEAARINEIDYLAYQAEEIEKASLSPDEEEELCSRRTILENAESLRMHAEKAYSLLGRDGGARELLHGAKKSLESLSDIDSTVTGYGEKAADLYYETEELLRDISTYMSSIEFNAAQLGEINDRLDTINSLKRKYNLDINGIIDFYDKACEKLLWLKSYDENKENLTLERDSLLAKANSLAQSISAQRHKSAKLLSERLCAELENLDMPKCKIEFSFEPCNLYENGNEHVEFTISTNPSEKPKSLAKIASGGEISRVMLAIKSVFSDFDKIPTLLFDEIDTGVSGRAAEKIANKMRTLSEKYQLICVTHLPVIAASAKHHLSLEKQFCEDSFKTVIRKLSYEDRVHEIARIISGDNINEISLKNARQMLGEG
ncbi:MAG: DNA repair protein RecN [Ruminococcaceae bacterium]|nr:DNA repair protein RecN [Oscillospiraceae bacterium]